MSSNFSRAQLADLMRAGTRPRAAPARARAVGEIMTVDVNFIESTPLVANRDDDQALTGTSPHSRVGDQGGMVHALDIAAGKSLSHAIARYEAAVPVRQLEMELT